MHLVGRIPVIFWLFFPGFFCFIVFFAGKKSNLRRERKLLKERRFEGDKRVVLIEGKTQPDPVELIGISVNKSGVEEQLRVRALAIEDINLLALAELPHGMKFGLLGLLVEEGGNLSIRVVAHVPHWNQRQVKAIPFFQRDVVLACHYNGHRPAKLGEREVNVELLLLARQDKKERICFRTSFRRERVGVKGVLP